MNYKSILCRCTLTITIMSCGGSGSSGIESSKYMDELSSDEISTLCDWMLEQQGGVGVETDCGDGLSTTTPTKDECTATTTLPHCQVSAVESCMEALDGNSCNLLSADGCADYMTCAFSSLGS